ncbi:KRAB-A domain-containing protein 2-like [Diabrotica undecimpunctata]|uniref:KRAB-A domain-containing protein 2-like n=1 Tax=Diabrotica undecimpunctata TaxID=50387 RepID=UPI003B63DD8C
MSDFESIKARFSDQIDTLKYGKGNNHHLFTRDKCYAFLMKAKTTKDKSSRKTPEEYQRLSRYDIVKMGNVEKLVVPVKNDRDVFMEETFDIIHETHISIGYGVRNRMMKELKTKYKKSLWNVKSKFVQLRALKTKCAEEVAYHLWEVLTIFGAPHILHSNIGRELANKIIEEVCSMWDELKIVHGSHKHSQSQSSVDRANQDIEKMLAIWLETNKTS